MYPRTSTSHQRGDVADTTATEREKAGINVLNAIFLPSLQRIALAKVGLIVWYSRDVQKAFTRDYTTTRINTYAAVIYHCRDVGIRKCAQMLKLLGMPPGLRKKVYNMVRGIADEICNWILYQNCCIFNMFEYTPATEALSYVDQIVWTSRGVVDYVETAKVLFQNREFGCDLKYVISSMYRLEMADRPESTAAPSLPPPPPLSPPPSLPVAVNDTLHIYVEDGGGGGGVGGGGVAAYGDNRVVPLFMFSNGDDGRLRMLARTNYSSYMASVLLFKSLDDNNAAVVYLWRLIHEMEGNNIAAGLANLLWTVEHQRLDWLYVLICQLSLKQQAFVFKSEVVKIITKYLDSAVWEDCFPHYAAHVSHYIDENLFLYVTTNLVKTISADRRTADNELGDVDYDRCKFMLKVWWQYVPRSHKDYVIAHNKNAILWDILKQFNWDKHSDVIEFLLAYVDMEVKKRILTSSRGLELCQILCLKNKLNWIDNLMQDMLPSEEINEFKEKLIKHYKDDFCAYIFYNKNADQFEKFLSWCFKTEKERVAYKANFQNTVFTLLLQLSVFGEDTLIQFGKDNLIRNCFVLSYHAHFKKRSDFSSLDYFLEWYFESSEEQIRNFKRSRMFGEDAYILEILMKREDYVNFTEEELVKWFCSNDTELMNQLRKEVKEELPKKKKVCV